MLCALCAERQPRRARLASRRGRRLQRWPPPPTPIIGCGRRGEGSGVACVMRPPCGGKRMRRARIGACCGAPEERGGCGDSGHSLCADAAALRAKRPAADDGERERRQQMRGTAAEARRPRRPSHHGARRLWRGAGRESGCGEWRTTRCSRGWTRHSERRWTHSFGLELERRPRASCSTAAGAGGKRAAEEREGEDNARARVRQCTSGGDGDEDAMIL